MKRRVLTLALVMLALALGLAACGGDDDGEEAEEPAPAETDTNGGGGGGGGATIELAADPGGALAFDTASLEAASGSFTIAFTNESTTPHNVTIEEVEGAATSTFTEGEEDLALELEPGTYTFFCSVPGHREAGMEGTLTVG